ncbi:hypothetical protein EIB18_03660 [Caulobacter vibrioides]|uniref:Uncharacterized protein n=1 Tax=Caulobacter vibrioides (strain ATCC 19089 / CIP 103742 / CB 15) TaxID=190650 RepID=Q9AAC0_CAUVC|nr:hypothetical protein CC_0682 [Caulobacter vibrioides CB15]AZH11900.1 hypothetical protein EIB18_03660 [Caulobacter vibrioides]
MRKLTRSPALICAQPPSGWVALLVRVLAGMRASPLLRVEQCGEQELVLSAGSEAR